MRPDRSTSSNQGPGRKWLVPALILAVMSVGVCLFSVFAAGFSCSLENSSCADVSAPDTLYHGRVFDYQGQPASGQELEFEDDVYGRGVEIPVRTDDEGRFCLRADHGDTSAFISVPGQVYSSDLVVDSTAPVDPRFSDSQLIETIRSRGSTYTGPKPNREAFIAIEPVVAGETPPSPAIHPLASNDAVELWDPATDLTNDCQTVDARVPFMHRSDASSSWSFALLCALSVAAIALFATGSRTRRRRASELEDPDGGNAPGSRWFQASCLAASANILVLVLILAGTI